MVYKFKPAARFREGFDEDAGANHLGALLEKHGRITREIVRDDALQESSPLYPALTHDATEALRIVNLNEADYLIRQWITVRIEDGAAREVRAVVPVFVDRDDEKRQYVATMDALSNEEWRKQVIENALREFLNLRRKWADLSELARIFEAIDQLTPAA
jgi:hypothetical protein